MKLCGKVIGHRCDPPIGLQVKAGGTETIPQFGEPVQRIQDYSLTDESLPLKHSSYLVFQRHSNLSRQLGVSFHIFQALRC